MKIETYGRKIELARADGVGVADRWKRQYDDKRYPEKVEIGRKLVALGPNPNPDEVDKVIGNQSWTRPYCTICGEYQTVALRVSSDSNDVCACADCMRLALSIIDGDKK